ncbi:hypothetical protein E1A91_A10G224000v1 [Gossypium mustelinum]|uniref:Serine carboxypeptidase-like 18 n=1 Tax=Gossypium mustelinum TaxID=34275 RepID=A0A5D2XQN6_GOSMU|nr:hypothetical protein E1A91_A10G224000v1 [Gossypium mustelinum]
MFSKYAQLLCFYYIVFIVVWNRHVVSFSDIRYIGVGDLEIFYYFIQSERDPSKDPLILWLTGGPGCSALSGLFFEIGPLQFNMVEYNGSLPTFALNPYSWTKVANIIFLDAPVGTGFSYSTTLQGFETGDKRFANDGYNFLRKWLQSHPKFITNSLYIAGDSYAGKIVPIIVHAISDGIEDENFPAFNLKGYLVGNPATGSKYDDNSKIPFYNRMALISDELYESAKRNCKEEYVEVEMSNVICAKDLQAISECIAHINKPHILEPECPSDFDPPDSSVNERKYFLETREEDCLQAPAEYPKFGCRNYNTYLCKIWASDDSVQQALGIRKGTIREWIRCNESLLYDKDVGSVVDYHLSLNTKGYRALIYSGDHDRLVPYVGTESWIKSLNLSIVDDWRPWFVDDQVAGYSREYGNNLTFATVKGGGHTAPEFKPKECFAMFNRWISKKSL